MISTSGASQTGDPVFVDANGADDVLGWTSGAPTAYLDDKFHLSAIASGQASNSPLIDTGSGTAASEQMDAKTTRTDSVVDTVTSNVDIGYHYGVATNAASSFFEN